MATFYTHRNGLFKKGVGDLNNAFKQAMDQDTIIVNQSKLAIDETVMLKGGVTLCGDESKSAPVLVPKERQPALFVAQNVVGTIYLKHLRIQLGNSTIGIKIKSPHVRVILEDVQFYYTNNCETPYNGVIIDSQGGARVEIVNSLITSIQASCNTLSIDNSNIGDWFGPSSKFITNQLMITNTALQNIVVAGFDCNSQAQVSKSSFGGNVPFESINAVCNDIELCNIPALNHKNKKTVIADDATSVIAGDGTKLLIKDFKVKNNEFNTKLQLPKWRTLGIRGGSLTLVNGHIINTGLRNIARSGDIVMENVEDDSQWSVENPKNLKTSNRNSQSELFDSKSDLNLTTEMSGIQESKSGLDKLNEMIGLDSVKRRVNQIISQAKMNAERKRRGLANSDKDAYLNMFFVGNAGTGKTTVARLIGQALYEAGVLKSTRFVEVGAKDLIGQHVGETKIKTHAVIESALDGVLFIDEAYSLAPPKGGGNSFNNEAVEELVQSITQYGGRLVVIMAGYTTDMRDLLNRSNEGLASRFPNWIEFPDYSVIELKQIERLHLKQSHARLAEPSVMQQMDKGIDTLLPFVTRMRGGGNGRFIANYVQKITEMRDERLSHQDISQLSDDQLMIITRDDVNRAVKAMSDQLQGMQV